MRKLTIVLMVLGVGVPLMPAMGVFDYDLQNGGLEDPFSSNVAVPWTYYQGGSGLSSISQSRETTIVNPASGLSVTSQKLAANTGSGSASARIGIRQTIPAGYGDAFMFGGWSYQMANGSYNLVSIRAAWGGGIDDFNATELFDPWSPYGTAAFRPQQWYRHKKTLEGGVTTYLAGGNATSDSGVTLFLHSRRNTANGNLITYWDDVEGYHTFRPPAPAVSDYSGTTAMIDVLPGGNAPNADAQYGVTITGGQFGETEGVYWMTPVGSFVNTAKPLLTDAQWGTKTIQGLLPDTAYTIKVLARYDGTRTQETYLSEGVVIPEPAIVAMLGVGSLMLLRRRR